MYWMTRVGSLTKKTWIFFIIINFLKKCWHLSDFISTIRLWNRHDLWNMRVASRTRMIVKQKEQWSSLQNLDRSDINTSRHFLKSWAAGGHTVDLRSYAQQHKWTFRGQFYRLSLKFSRKDIQRIYQESSSTLKRPNPISKCSLIREFLACTFFTIHAWFWNILDVLHKKIRILDLFLNYWPRGKLMCFQILGYWADRIRQ